MIELSPSVLGADLMRLGEEVKRVKELGIGWLHLDHMDGHFVPNISFGPDFVAAIRQESDLFLDVHLMLSHPLAYVPAYVKAGSDLITVHVEAEDDPETTLRAIRTSGVKAGISIKPNTPPEAIEHLLPLCDLVLVMTVEPGFGGQKFMADTMPKIAALRELGYRGQIMVDGGINADTAAQAVAAGADALVMGTALLRAEDPAAVVRACRALEGRT